MANEAKGTIVWRELHVDSLERADAFYGELFNWERSVEDYGDFGDYLLFKDGEKSLAGAMNKPNPAAPSHWMDYIYTADLDATVETIKELGGTIYMEATDIPDMGRFAVAADPTGAVFAPFQANWREEPNADRPPDFTFCWTQVNSTDMNASAEFFAKVFNWEMHEMPGDMEVVSLKAGEVDIISVMQMPEDSPAPSHFIDYVAVPDIGEYHEKATSLGGTGYVPPTEIPGMGSFSVLADSNGAMIALWENAT